MIPNTTHEEIISKVEALAAAHENVLDTVLDICTTWSDGTSYSLQGTYQYLQNYYNNEINTFMSVLSSILKVAIEDIINRIFANLHFISLSADKGKRVSDIPPDVMHIYRRFAELKNMRGDAMVVASESYVDVLSELMEIEAKLTEFFNNI